MDEKLPSYNESISEKLAPSNDPSYGWEGSHDYPATFVLQPGFIKYNSLSFPISTKTQPEKSTVRGGGGGITSFFRRSNKAPKKGKIVFSRWIVTDRICPAPGETANAEHEPSEDVVADMLEYRDGSKKRVQMCIRTSSAGSLQFQVLPGREDSRRHGKKSCSCCTRVIFWADVPGGRGERGGVWSGTAPFEEVKHLKVSLIAQGQKEIRWMDTMFKEWRDCDGKEWVSLKKNFETDWRVIDSPDSTCLSEGKDKETD